MGWRAIRCLILWKESIAGNWFRSSRIVLYLPISIHAGDFETPIYDPTGARAKVGQRDGGKLAWVAVPSGMDGKVWSLDRLVQVNGDFETLTILQVFALEPDVHGTGGCAVK